MNRTSTAQGSIVGLVAAVPDRVITNADCPDPAAANEAAKITGVRERRWVKPGQSTASLCTAAARRLLDGMGWAGDSLDLIVYVTQTPERGVPADVYSFAAYLGATCPCLQVNWSCSGFVYGLWTAMRLLEQGKRALLLVGDATSTIADPGDRATAPLFGDAGSATAIIGGGPYQNFVMGTDGAGVEKLCTIPDLWRDELGELREALSMDGAAVFNFTLKTVPALALDVATYGIPDYWLMHQANAMIVRHLTKKSGIDPLRAPINIERFGNTSCASIPLLMADGLAAKLTKDGARLAMLGFGAGYAWCGASIRTEPLTVCELIEV